MLRPKFAGPAAAALLAAGLLANPASQAIAGSGGPSVDLERRTFTASNGLTSQYHIYAAGVPTDRPVGLLIQFHGDGAFEFNNPSSSYSLGGPSGIVAKAKEHDLLTIAALSPDKQGAVTWWEQGDANADYARDLIQNVAFAKYSIDTGNVWLVGYSGGAQFITQFFLPKHSNLVGGGGSVVFGGGGVPRASVQPFAASLKANFPMHWHTGAADTGTSPGWYDALADAKKGSAWYSAQGFQTTLETPAGVGHAGLPFGRVVGEQLAKHLDAILPPAVPVPDGVVPKPVELRRRPIVVTPR